LFILFSLLFPYYQAWHLLFKWPHSLIGPPELLLVVSHFIAIPVLVLCGGAGKTKVNNLTWMREIFLQWSNTEQLHTCTVQQILDGKRPQQNLTSHVDRLDGLIGPGVLKY
jgi:hypothetical protein